MNGVHYFTKPLKRMQANFPELPKLSDTELFRRNKPVFRSQNGKLIKHEQLAENFRLLLKHCDLLENTAGSYVAYIGCDILMPPSRLLMA